ncbi:MAG: ABC transporter permease [Candidatus Krumholzibacteriota bacterium]|nr:ABC transporter permease [Candidatus Krumholzibacteriota bacterium]
MLRNFFKVALRNFLKYKIFSFINVAGLAIGISCSLLVFLFVRYELSYDRFHEKGDRIYRLASRASIGNTKIDQTGSSAETFRVFAGEFPEIESGIKFLRLGRLPVYHEGRTFYERNCHAVDATFFDIFSVPLLSGDPQTVLAEPNTIVLTRAAALKYFGRTDVVGEMLRLGFSGRTDDLDLKITGVAEELPDNSHFHFNILVSLETFPSYINATGWSRNNFVTYLLLRPGASAEALEAKIADFTRNRAIDAMGEERYQEWRDKGNFWTYYLQPLTGIHLDSDLNGEFEANGDRNYVNMFMIISVFVLLIACFNFMNLSTARASLRAREVSIRKVVGSGRNRLILQFLSESVLLSLIAMIVAVAIIFLLLPAYRNFVGREIELDLFANASVLPALLGFAVGIGIIAGAYPAFALSSFNPVTALKGRMGSDGRELWIRNALVILQFAIAIFLVVGVLTVSRQMKFLQDKELGFDKEQVLVINNPGSLQEGKDTLKDILRNLPGVVAVSGSDAIPGSSFGNIGFGAEGKDDWFTLNICMCDPGYWETMKLEMIEGRFFSRDFKSDSTAAILNEAALRLIGWDDPLGREIYNGSTNVGRFQVIGIVRDYHYESLHQEIRPQALFFLGGYYNRTERFLSVRLETAEISGSVDRVKAAWNDFVQGVPFDHFFLDESYDNLYRNERQIGRLFSTFSILAIFIGCLGLFGLSAFVVDRRKKEIGIRKVLGASVAGIVRLLNTSFLKAVLAANLIAWPAAWYILNRWLRNFAYRIDLGVGVFLWAGILAFAIALATVSFQTFRAALADPVNSIRYE